MQSNNGPSREAILSSLAETTSTPWFPSDYAQSAGFDLAMVDELVWELCRANLVEVSAWYAQRGQAFRLTELGRNEYLAKHQEQHPDYTDTARERLIHPTPPIVVPILLTINISWFLFGLVIAWRTGGSVEYLRGNNDPVVSWILLRIGAVSGLPLMDGEYWRFFTFGLVHVGFLHLLGTQVILALQGSLAESIWGRWRFALIYLLSGIIGGVVTMAMQPQLEEFGHTENVILGGAVGSLWAITLASFAWLSRNLPLVPRAVGQDWVRKMAVVSVMFIMISIYPGHNLLANLTSGVSGVVVALTLSRLGYGWRIRLAALGALLGMIVSAVVLLVFNMHTAPAWKSIEQEHRNILEQRKKSATSPDSRATPD